MYANTYDIPVSLAFSLAWAESGTPYSTLKYVTHIMEYKEKLEASFQKNGNGPGAICRPGRIKERRLVIRRRAP